MEQIKWNSKRVEVSKIKHTPRNYKIKTDLGKARLHQSLKLFGLAGTVIVNTDFTLIDGNSRLEEAKENKEKMIWVSIPNRKLTPKEFNEFAAMYDYAKAGEVDIEAIENDLGTREEFFKKWNMQIPMRLLDKMGKGATVKGEELEYPEEGKGGKKGAEGKISDIKMLQLFFTEKQEIEFRKMEDKLATKFQTINLTDTVFKAFKQLTK